MPENPQDLTWSSQKVYHRHTEAAGQAQMFSNEGIRPRLAAALCTAGSHSACTRQIVRRPVCSAEQAQRLESCVLKLKEREDRVNPFAVCSASVGCRREPMSERGRANMKKVADLSVGELEALIKRIVRSELEEMLGDPDEGLELTDECKESLRRSLASKEPGLSSEQVAAELGLKWPSRIK